MAEKPKSCTSFLLLGTLFFLFLLSSSLVAFAEERVVLNPPPWPAEVLSSRIYSARINHQAVVPDPLTGEIHLLLGYVASSPFQLLDANLSKGTVRVVDGAPGRPGPNAFAIHPNGNYYLASSDPGVLLEYDLRKGVIRQVGKLADKGGQWLEIGDDGAVYIGEHVKGHVERYGPATGAWDDFGIVDDPGPPYYRYAYSLGADDRYVYVGIGQNPWYLAVYDRQTRTSQTFWKDLKPAEVMVMRGQQGGWLAHVGGQGWFELKNGRPVPLQKVPAPVPFVWRGGVCSDPTSAKCNLPVEIDLGRATPMTASSGVATAEISFRNKGEEAWKKLSAPVRVVPQAVKQLQIGPADEVLGFTAFYGPLFTISRKEPEISKVLGTTLRSNYDALYLPDNGRWYIAGYPAALLEYDPKKPWSLLPGRDPADPLMNPHQPVPGFGKYHYYLARGADGMVYVGVHHERNAEGGELGWFDPVSGKKGSLREPFEKFDVRDLKPALAGKKLVYSSVALKDAGGRQPDARLFVFDVASKRIEREIVPLPGVGELDKVVETSPGVVVGVAGSEVYSVDIRDGRVLYRKSLGGHYGTVKSNDRRLQLGPDGHVWLVLVPFGVGSLPQLTRINPVTGVVEMLQGVPGLQNFLLVKNQSGTGYDALLYGTEELRKISDVLTIKEEANGGAGS